MLYRERLSVPVSYWFIAAAFGLTTVSAVGFYLGPEVAVAATLLCAALIAAALLLIGRDLVIVDERGLTVGRSLLEWEYLGEPQALDRLASQDRQGPLADARAFVVARPYIPEAVEVPVRDAADPHPYWLVSTRRPQQLLAALTRGRARHGAGSDLR
ncbi:DUF3093 domain-containing protein [Nigerium massiliense]|uniref:DUF3093 domain-containing protein n=1 Tax=Nigerium massiliense TaxID=1522317 RepID=UPI0009078003|nr:DUF3093 domain-containing protein [Nigerium massiliense]